MHCPAQEGAGPFLGRTVDAEIWRAGLRGTCSAPSPAAPGSWHRSSAGSQLLHRSPGRIWWCFSGHVLCSCSRLMGYFFFPGIYPKASSEAGGSQHTPGTSITLPSSSAGDAPAEPALPSPGNGGYSITRSPPTPTAQSWLCPQALFLHLEQTPPANPGAGRAGKEASLESFLQATALFFCTHHAQAATESGCPRALTYAI